MPKKNVFSIKDELIRKGREAVLAAVQVYNNPNITFKAETFITLAVIGWTYLLHAYYRSQKIDYRYYKQLQQRKKYDRTKYGAYKYWELERCLNDDHCPLDSETVSNLRFLIGIRHEIEHQMTNKIDEFLSAKLQACAINFDYYIIRLFGRKYSLNKDLSLAIQFSPLSPEQREGLQDNPHITSNIKNFVVDYESDLTDETLKSSRYAYRVLFVPINAKRPGQADRVVEFIKGDSPEAEGIEKAYTYIKETEKPKYRPKEIVNLMKDEGFPKFTISKHTDLWKEKDAKNKKYAYGTEVSGTWYWYGTWLEIVRQYCQDNRDALIYSVTSADLHGVDLIQIKVCCGPSNVALRKIPLVFLIGYQVLNRDLFKMNIGDKLIQIFHSVLLDSAQQIAHVISQRKKLPDESFPCMGRDDGQIRLFQNPVDRT